MLRPLFKGDCQTSVMSSWFQFRILHNFNQPSNDALPSSLQEKSQARHSWPKQTEKQQCMLVVVLRWWAFFVFANQKQESSWSPRLHDWSCLWAPSMERLQANKIEGFSKMFFTLQAVILWLRLFYTQCQFQNLCGRLGQATRHQVKYADIARWRWISIKNRFPKFFKFQLVNWNPLEPFAI